MQHVPVFWCSLVLVVVAITFITFMAVLVF